MLSSADLSDAVYDYLESAFFSDRMVPEMGLFSLYPRFLDESVIQAENLTSFNQFSIYNSLFLEYPDNSFSWLLDPLTGFSWPCKEKTLSDPQYKPSGTDIKTIWEISRFQQLTPLVYAYLSTGDSKFPVFALSMIESWISQNPPEKGPHWTIPMEAAIRLLNWTVALPQLDIHKYAERAFLGKLGKSFYDHIVFIRENLEKSIFKSNNHYLSNIVGLLASRLIFPSKPFAVECSEFAVNELFKEIESQFLSDGINFEGSLSYHRLSCELICIGLVIVAELKVPVPQKVVQRVKKIAEFTKYYTACCTETPVLGDNDSGIVINLFAGQASNDHSYLNRLFDFSLNGLQTIGPVSDSACSNALKKNKANTTSFSKRSMAAVNSDSTISFMIADGLIVASLENEGFFFNCMRSSQGHTHNDKLSFYPIFGKLPLFVDRGTFSYTGYPEKRRFDRSSLAHNAPVVNHWEQNRYWDEDPFYIADDARPEYSLKSDDDSITVTGRHIGYHRFRKGLTIFRKILWRFRDRIFIIEDWVDSPNNDEDFTLSWNFLINPVWNLSNHGSVIRLESDLQQVYIKPLGKIIITVETSSYCPSYQKEFPCMAIKCRFNAKSSQRGTLIIKATEKLL